MARNQAVERRALPKRIKAEMKAREMMYRESLRISVTNLQEVITPKKEKDRFKKFQEAEKNRYTREVSLASLLFQHFLLRPTFEKATQIITKQLFIQQVSLF